MIPFIMPHKAVISLDILWIESLKCGHLNESYRAVFSSGAGCI